ncbi:MAG: OmpH family outer membrane protein [Bacteroidia bacterium]|nr:OmpH family outer membrane protein [Bacteroidia bacterium]
MEKVLKIIALAAFVIFVAASAVQDGTTKLGYLNSAAILAELPEVKAADADLEVLQNQLQKKGEKMVQDLQSKYQAIAQKVQAGQVSPAQQQEEEKKLQTLNDDIQKFDVNMRNQLAEKRNELYEPIIQKVNDAIKVVGKEGNFKMVFDLTSTGIVYADEAQDISELVKAKL